MSWFGVNKVEIQFGYTAVATNGIAPLLMSNSDMEESKNGLITMPDENVHTSIYSTFSPDIYIIVAGQDEVSAVNYLIVSSR